MFKTKRSKLVPTLAIAAALATAIAAYFLGSAYFAFLVTCFVAVCIVLDLVESQFVRLSYYGPEAMQRRNSWIINVPALVLTLIFAKQFWPGGA